MTPSTAAAHRLTQLGDIALANTRDRPFAVVLHAGGAVVGTGVEVLRLHADWLDPDVVATLLSSPLAPARPASTRSNVPPHIRPPRLPLRMKAWSGEHRSARARRGSSDQLLRRFPQKGVR
jgi:hypothetical protein